MVTMSASEFSAELGTAGGDRERFRPRIGGRDSAAKRIKELGALLVIALKDFAFSHEPVLGFVAGLESATLGKQKRETANLVLQIDGENIGAPVILYDGWFAQGLVGLSRNCFSDIDSHRGRSGLNSSDSGFAILLFGNSWFCHGVLLTTPM